jgi:asparagine N-glycosylation enzyme membrane subunit Stt3
MPVGLCLLVALVALFPRVALDVRWQPDDGSGFSTADPDSLYQMRRLTRFLDGGWSELVRDPFLDHPNGSAIPWPAGYALVQAALLGPGRPADPAAARQHVEQGVASLPLWLGVLTAMVVFGCGWRLSGPAVGAGAGLYFALCGAPIEGSRWGNGDHHAFVLLLTAGWTCVLLDACRARAPRRLGAALAGCLCGAALVTWVPSVFLVAVGVVSMLSMLWAEQRRDGEGALSWWLVHWGFALLVVVPFAAVSPWTAADPWNPAYLTLIQPASLALAALVPATGLACARAPGRAARRRTHLLAWGAVFASGALLYPFVRDVLPGALGAAGDVLMRADEWHDLIVESRPLFGPEAHVFGVGGLLGWGAWLAPLALVVAAREAWRERATPLAPVLALALITGAAALLQARFADLFAVPLALLLALTLDRARAALERRAGRRLPPARALLAGMLLMVGLQGPTFARVAEYDAPAQAGREQATRGALEWLRAQAGSFPQGGVLATWSHGHAVLWIADRPAVASNFGPFTGRAGYEAPARFLLEGDPDVAEALAAARDVAFVLVRGNLPASVPSQLRMLGRADETGLVSVDAQGRIQLGRAWLETMGARLLACADPSLGIPSPPEGQPSFLRLVHASPPALPGARAFLYQRVAGAVLEVHGRPAERLSAAIAVSNLPGRPPTDFLAQATADASGVGLLRVPYATGRQGDVLAGPCRISGEGRDRQIDLDELDVVEGRRVTVRLDEP